MERRRKRLPVGFVAAVCAWAGLSLLGSGCLAPARAADPRGEPAAGDVAVRAPEVPAAPVVQAYIYMAVDAHDRWKDVDGAHDWLVRALELDPYNATARAMLARVKEEKQQAGLKRMGVALGVLQQMLEKSSEQGQEEAEEGGPEEGEPEEGEDGGDAPPAGDGY